MSNIFRKDYNQYRRDFDFVKLWKEQNVTYASIMDPTIDKVAYRQWLDQQTTDTGLFPVSNPKMRLIQKDENNDRYLTTTTVTDYLRAVVKQDLKFAPTFTTYMPEHRKKAVESSFLTVGMAKRGAAKKKKFAAIEALNSILASYWDNMQLMYKILNNSSSGAHATDGNILFNQTGHSTLTSICRSTTSFANSVNEKFFGGYRHYYNEKVTINNIVATLTYIDIDKTKRVIDKYGLQYITPEDLLDVIKRSTDLYWDSPLVFEKIANVVKKLTPLQCTAYLYNSDFYHLRQFNQGFVRRWLKELLDAAHVEPLTDIEEAKRYIGIMDSDLACLIAIYGSHIYSGKSVKSTMDGVPDSVPYFGAVVKHTLTVLEKYRDLIEVFWVTDIMPANTAFVPEMMRGVVLGSDTDSSLFTVDEWVAWYNDGVIRHDHEADCLEATIVYFVSQHIAHVLGMMTGIINIIDEKKPLIAMKNEFMFSSFTTTSLGKHYYAKKEAQEGVLISKRSAEIKGVVFKHSKVPAKVANDFHEYLHERMKEIKEDRKIQLLPVLADIASLENDIHQSILGGNAYYLTRGQIKAKSSYKNENNIYKKGYEMWEAVFADKYGHTGEPPYDIVKINIIPDTRTRYKAWTDTFEDRALADRLWHWIDTENNGNVLKTFSVPIALMTSHGIPKEILSATDIRRIVYGIVAPYYVALESYGIFRRNKNITRLFSDDFPSYRIPTNVLLDEFDSYTDIFDDSDDDY
nr:MAG TPA: DNA polymerase [Caudoviricetes sp.]